MAKIEASKILKEGAELKVEKINFNDEKVISFVVETKRKQEEILQLKRVDREKLRLVIQLY
jgi:hypothetical protein